VLKILQNTKVVLPFYVKNDEVDTQLAITTSSNKTKVSSKIVDSSTGAFKIVDSNSILFLELTAKGAVGDNEEITLKIQEEDATRYDKEDFNVTIVDSNYTYNRVNLYFTYNTIIIEEGDSRNIYFGISYTIDSNVTVVVRSDIEKILSDDNTTLDLPNISENNNILSTYVENDEQVPFYFKLTAKGKAGDTMELYLVAKDSRGNYDFKKFNVLIVGVGEGAYEKDDNTTNSDTNYTALVGDDFDLLSEAQQALVSNDNNNYELTSITRPIITIFNPSEPANTIKIPKGKSITTTFYVKDFDKDEIYTAIYDDLTKVIGTLENYGKFTVTYSNKLFFLKLTAIGNAGDIVPITIYSQNRNDATKFDQQTFNVEIVDENSEGSYIEPLIYIGFNKLYIEEGGYRDGLTFSVSHSKTLSLEIDIEDEEIAKFLQWISQDPPKFSLKAVGRSGQTTKATIRATDGVSSDQRVIDIIIIPNGTLSDYLDDEIGIPNEGDDDNTLTCPTGQHVENNICVNDTTDTNNTLTCPTGQHVENNICVNDTTDTNNTLTCETGFHLENGVCKADTTTITCQTGYTLVNGNCVSIEDNTTISDPVCQTGYHIEDGKCISDVVNPICQTGYTLINGTCVPESDDDNKTPTCESGYHLEDGECISDVVDPTCQTGYTLINGNCVKNDNDDEVLPPLCQDGYNLENGICVIELVCETGFHIENDTCIADLPTCEDGFHLEGKICVADPLVCEDGYHEKNGVCVVDETSCEDGFHVEDGVCVSDRDLDTIPYDEWTDPEKNAKSVEICDIKMVEAGYTVLKATAVRAEGFTNERETIILHTNKTPIVNGVTQNVTITMIYKEDYAVTSTENILDATYTVPKFRIDYSAGYGGDTFYVIDEGNGKCYVNTFPNADTLPFGVLEIVKPDDIN
jgi:hypothetical protein